MSFKKEGAEQRSVSECRVWFRWAVQSSVAGDCVVSLLGDERVGKLPLNCAARFEVGTKL